MNKLISSIPANNDKVIELYNKLESGQLNPKPIFQRKLVWRKQHKYDFIDTILSNFPFPEIYIAPGEIDTKKMQINEFVVDGQQRLTAIRDYINGKGVFALPKIPVKKFDALDDDERSSFLSYEVSVRYLKNATDTQIADIFQRINRTEYALNKTERLNAEWGDSEFVCFAKQIIEEELDLNMDIVNYKITTASRNFYLSFFHTKNKIFTENDNSRMLSLQFILTIIATICDETYANRNIRVQEYIENQFDEFQNASTIDMELLKVLKFIDKIKFENSSYWFNKANIFTLIVELYKYNLAAIDVKKFKSALEKIEEDNSAYLIALKEKKSAAISKANEKYIEASREGVNSKNGRDYRGKVIEKIIVSALKK